MTRKEILRRWLALKQGTGLAHARRVHYYLLFGSFAIVAAVLGMSRFYELPWSVTMVSGIAVGWLIGEANSLKFRLDHFPIYCEYFDWAKVEHDWQADGPPN